MEYRSLFMQKDFEKSTINFRRDDGSMGYRHLYDYYLQYRGTLESVLTDLESMKGINIGELDSRQKIIWGAPRIIRGVLDYKTTSPLRNSQYNIPELVLTATQAVLDIYQNPLRIPTAVREVRDCFLGNSMLDGILDMIVSQKSDDTTFDSTSPKYSNRTVDCLLNKFKGRNLLFIITAHGGVPAGLDVFLKYQSLSNDGDSIVYPVRYSKCKFNDLRPRLKQSEVEYLKHARGSRSVVIFDEDISGGGTIKGMKAFFSDGIFPEKRVFITANFSENRVVRMINGFKWKPRKEPSDEENTGDYTMFEPIWLQRTAS